MAKQTKGFFGLGLVAAFGGCLYFTVAAKGGGGASAAMGAAFCGYVAGYLSCLFNDFTKDQP